ncbi:SusE domain-containing protein [Mucilaginibacter sp. Bleaf8]|uniref:SusE domain-containing protein n=1 Tax=Mucilaginibacter sp. Bleaf8 TaxID=2834430 RepID=UPI001BD11903|nr:SusE domain-containing protein [Mucilaginibacter sp. Bleaf8]MBS7564086.1 SusE domain-containing protein [Mucilaginibacter sp. Bleaf8]
MKNILYKLFTLGTAITALISTGCNKDKELNHTNVTPVNTFFAPENNAAIKLDPKAGTQLFEWETSRAEDGGLVYYEVAFDKENGDFSQPIYTTVSDERGMANRLNMSHADLNKIAQLAGIATQGKGKIKWTVWASKGINQQKTGVSRIMEIERPEGFAEIPTDLYLTGTATEGGTDLTKAVRFKKTANGVFEAYTQLKAGTYHFASGTAGDAKTYSFNGNKLVEGGEMTVTGDAKVYRIKVEFEKILATNTQIESVGLWFSPDGKVLANIPYIGNGIWKITNLPIAFKVETWGRDERYKFRLAVRNAAGVAGTEWFGSSNKDNSRPDANSKADYYYLNPVDGSQFDYAYKFASAVDNKSIDLTLDFSSAGSAYTHTVTVK